MNVFFHLKMVTIRVYQTLRGLKYRVFSTARLEGSFHKVQPVLFAGQGRVISEGMVHIGVLPSPYLINGYAHIEARKPQSVIRFGDQVWLNNSPVIISDGAGIYVGDHTIAGPNLQIYDSDFHSLDPRKRMSGDYEVEPVFIGSNVFLGANVTILKGVTIGENSVIAADSVVTRDIPPNVLAAGNPAKVIRSL